MTVDCIAAAQRYNWPLIKLSKPGDPGPAPGKRPVGSNWETRPGLSAEQARRALEQGFNIGIRTGGNLLVVDCDGDRPAGLPDTLTVRTGSGGQHLYYYVPTGTTFRVGNTNRWIHPTTDTRWEGGQVVAPGSIHAETGALYEWADGLSPDDLPLTVLPRWVIEAINNPQPPEWRRVTPKPAVAAAQCAPDSDDHRARYIAGAIAGAIRNVLVAPEGQRNVILNNEAFGLAGLGVDPTEYLLEPALQSGLPEREVRATLRSATKGGKEKPRQIPPAKTGKPKLTVLPTAGSAAVAPESQPQADAEADALWVLAPNPRQLAEKYHQQDPHLRYWRGNWYRYTGTHYAEITQVELHRAVSGAVATWHYYDAKSGDCRICASAINESLLTSTIAQLRGLVLLPDSTEQPCWLDGESTRPAPEWISLKNVLLCLVPDDDENKQKRATREHTPAFFTTMSLPFSYDPEAESPEAWIEFLAATWPGEDGVDAAALLAEWFGYVLSRDMKYHKMLWIIGPTRSGKGLISRTLTALVGPDVTCSPTLSSLGDRAGGQVLIGKRLSVIGDARLSRRRHDTPAIIERLLSISGGDRQTFPRKYLPDWTGTPEVKFVLLSNDLPPLADESGALLGRLLLLETTKSHIGREDRFLEARIMRELPGILNWALDGLERLNAQGRFTEPRGSRSIIAAFRNMSAPLTSFVEECCVVAEGASVERGALYAAYLRWAEDEGITRPYNKNRFGTALRSVVPGLETERVRTYEGRARYYTGLTLS